MLAFLIALPSLYNDLSPDGYYYWYAAQSFRRSSELLNDPTAQWSTIIGTGRYYVTYAPLLPIVASVFDDYHIAAYTLNSIALLGLAVWCIKINAKYSLWLFLATFPIWRWYGLLLSDGLFVTCIAWYLLLATEQVTFRRVLLMALLIVVISTLRYAGLLALPLFGLWVLWHQWKYIPVVMWSALPALTWLARNLYYTGSITGHSLQGVDLQTALQQLAQGLYQLCAGLLLLIALYGLRVFLQQRT